jgi:hypothetical protein
MATINEVVSEALSGLAASSGAGEQLATLAQQIRQLQAVNQAAAESTKDNTRAVERNTSAQGPGSSTAATVGRTLESFGWGLGLSPLITGLLRLFGGGGGSSAPPPLVKFALPPAVNASAGVSERAPGQVIGVDYGQGNVPRVVTAPAQVTVQVQAMDSRSFLDHSQEIALAVRQAMLESSVLNDVVREA